MELVRYGRVWEIHTREDFERAVEALEGADFCARMCDEYAREVRERAEVARQMSDVYRQARELGIL